MLFKELVAVRYKAAMEVRPTRVSSHHMRTHPSMPIHTTSQTRSHHHQTLSKQRKTPLFRTLQWSWFAAAMLYAHGDSIVRTLREAQMLDKADAGEEVPEKSLIFGSFSIFSVLFVVSVLTLRPGMYKYQVCVWRLVCWCGVDWGSFDRGLGVLTLAC